MPKVIRHFAELDGQQKATAVGFKCPGCGMWHVLPTHQYHNGEGGAQWGFNDNFDKPTFTPSILMRTGHYIPEHNSANCYCNWNERYPDDPIDWTCQVCHSFVTDGRIQFLGDCTHNLAGQTVDLPEITDP